MNAIDWFVQRAGVLGGHGIDHLSLPFHGELEIDALSEGQGVALKFRAEGIDGVVHRVERAWISESDGVITLRSLRRDGAKVRIFEQRHGAPAPGAEVSLVFGLGDRSDEGVFRVELVFDLWPGGEITYRTAWGRPGEPFEPRSSVRMSVDGRTPISPARRSPG